MDNVRSTGYYVLQTEKIFLIETEQKRFIIYTYIFVTLRWSFV